MGWPTLNLDTLERPRPRSVTPAPASQVRPGHQSDQARQAREKLDKLVRSLTAKATKAKVAPPLRVRKDWTISYEAYVRRKRLGLRVLAGLALAGLSAVLLSGWSASWGWSAEGRARRLAMVQHEARALTGKISELGQQVEALNRRAGVQANYLSELRADPAGPDLTADEAKAAAINADLDRLTREETQLRGQLHALGTEIVGLQGP
jgi:hypothetical protein